MTQQLGDGSTAGVITLIRRVSERVFVWAEQREHDALRAHDALEAELRLVREELQMRTVSGRQASEDRFAAIVDRDRARASLVQFGVHDTSCGWRTGSHPCDCGFDAALQDADPEGAEAAR